MDTPPSSEQSEQALSLTPQDVTSTIKEPENMTEHDKDLGARGKKHVLKGKLDEVVGKAEKQVGKVIGKPEMQAKGAAREVKGKIEAKGGEAEQKVDETLHPDKNT